MAEQEPYSLSSTYPNPPPFWRDFTPDRVARIQELRSQQGLNAQSDGDVAAAAAAATSDTRIADLPVDLINLQPPAEPADGRWRVFGDQYMLDDKLPTLEEQGITNLPSTAASSAKDAKHYDRAIELKRLAKSLLLNFLEMSGTLSVNASHAEAKMQDLRTLFINMHHIINEYRPHQARESAIEMMQDHRDRTRAETVAIRTQVDKARRVLEGLGSLSIGGEKDAGGGNIGGGGEEGEGLAAKREAEVWAAVDAMFA